jgi:hypothetical protein
MNLLSLFFVLFLPFSSALELEEDTHSAGVDLTSVAGHDGAPLGTLEKASNTVPLSQSSICVDGLVKAPKHKIRPLSGKCRIEDGGIKHFEKCCDLHSACYMSCGIDKETVCDQDFDSCIQSVCVQKYKMPFQKKACAKLTSALLSETTGLNNTYTASQTKACDCLPETEVEPRVREYALEFVTSRSADKVNRAMANDEPSWMEQYLAKRNYGGLLYRLYRKYPKAIEIVPINTATNSNSEL